MKTIKEIYKIGLGPSSSHTMGPRKAAEIFMARHADAARTEVTLYGSLAATGKGHMTDVAIMDAIPGITIEWKPKTFLPFHPNGMEFRAYNQDGKQTDSWQVFSIGGGELAEESQSRLSSPDIYELNKMTDILKYCERSGKSYWEYVADVRLLPIMLRPLDTRTTCAHVDWSSRMPLPSARRMLQAARLLRLPPADHAVCYLAYSIICGRVRPSAMHAS